MLSGKTIEEWEQSENPKMFVPHCSQNIFMAWHSEASSLLPSFSQCPVKDLFSKTHGSHEM